MATVVTFENSTTGQIKEAPIGFSWTVLLFGFFPPIFRGDWKWAIIMLIIASLTMGASNFVFMFMYNKLYIKDLISDGYKVKSVNAGTVDTASHAVGLDLPAMG